MARIACMLTALICAVPIALHPASAAAGGSAGGALAAGSASSERTSKTIPRGARILRISVHGSLEGEQPTQRPLLVTSVRKIDEIVALLDALPAAQPGIRSCPADFGIEVRLAFRTAHGTTPLALAEVDPQGCGGVRLAIGDKPQPGLEGGRSLIRQIDRVLGVKLDVSPVSRRPSR
jgi:hypothetical protein